MFTRERYAELIEASRQIEEFEAFVINRFLDYTKFTNVKAAKTAGAEPTVEIGVVETERDKNGWGGWKLDTRSLFRSDADYFIIFHYMEDEREPTAYFNYVKMPKAFVFGEMERDAEYQEYLRLKAKFEGDA